jgi:hypothetical protein
LGIVTNTLGSVLFADQSVDVFPQKFYRALSTP